MSEFITIKFGTGTEAFEASPTAEIARILRKIAKAFEQDGLPEHAIYDKNKQFIGEVLIDQLDEDES